MSDPVDPAARHTIAFTKAAPDLLRFFERRVGDAAPDLVAETFAVAWRRRHLIPTDSVDTRRWLFGIAHNVLHNARRSQLRRNRLADRLRAHWQAATDETPDTLLDVRAAIDALPAEQADIVTLIHWDGFTSSEVGLILGLPASTVRSRYASAKQQLAKSLHTPDGRPADQTATPSATAVCENRHTTRTR